MTHHRLFPRPRPAYPMAPPRRVFISVTACFICFISFPVDSFSAFPFLSLNHPPVPECLLFFFFPHQSSQRISHGELALPVRGSCTCAASALARMPALSPRTVSSCCAFRVSLESWRCHIWPQEPRRRAFWVRPWEPPPRAGRAAWPGARQPRLPVCLRSPPHRPRELLPK